MDKEFEELEKYLNKIRLFYFFLILFGVIFIAVVLRQLKYLYECSCDNTLLLVCIGTILIVMYVRLLMRSYDRIQALNIEEFKEKRRNSNNGEESKQ